MNYKEESVFDKTNRDGIEMGQPERILFARGGVLEGERAGKRVVIGDQKAANQVFGFENGAMWQEEHGTSEESIDVLQQ